MKRPTEVGLLLLAMACGVCVVANLGCGLGGEPAPAGSAAAPTHAHDAHADCSHPAVGPHHGDLIELGADAYHAELVHSESTGAVSVYLLDASARAPVATDALELSVNLSQRGMPQQFALVGSPQPSDTEGQSSRFVSSDPALAQALDRHGASGQLVVRIAGKQFRGDIHYTHRH